MIPTKAKVRALDPGKWNELLDTLAQRLPIRCVRTGQKWTHPWLVTPEWKPKDPAAENAKTHGEWVFRIKPGFVNGIDAEVGTLGRLADARTLDRIEEETDKRPTEKQPVTAYLTENPLIPFGGNRIIGKGASPEEVIQTDDGAVSYKFEGVPEFFYQFGVNQESVVFTGQLNSGIQLVDPSEPTPKESPPVLRAVDVILEVDRLSAKLDILRGNGFIDSYNALYFLTYGRATPAKERPTLRPDAKYIPKIEVEIGSFTQDITDAETDSLKIATIYLLSPKDTPISTPPDGTWRHFVKHEVFWNLAHAPAVLPDPVEFEPLRLVTNLVAGLADSIFASQLSTLNDNMSIATALLQRPNLTGRFWSL
jgi:hypothetical protein